MPSATNESKEQAGFLAARKGESSSFDREKERGNAITQEWRQDENALRPTKRKGGGESFTTWERRKKGRRKNDEKILH